MVRRVFKCLFFLLPVVMLSFPAYAGTITLADATAGLFNASSGNRIVTVTGSEPGYGAGLVANVNISINFAKADGEAFDPPYPTSTPFHNEIHFRLTGPLGGWVDLIAAGSFGSGSTLFDGTITFDQAAALVVNYDPLLPHAGTYRPTGLGSLSDFNGTSALGAWTLLIQDTVGADALRYRSMQLDITTTGSEIPEPGTWLLAATGVLGLALLRRRR